MLSSIRAAAGGIDPVPNEPLDMRGIRHTWAMIYGLAEWGDLFTSREALAMTALIRALHAFTTERSSDDISSAIQVCLALAIDRQANAMTSLSRWNTTGEKIEGLFARQAIPLLWDYAEANPFSGASGGLDGAIEWVAKVCDANTFLVGTSGQVANASAAHHPLPDDSVSAIVTDPPYYDAVPYAFLSDFFYVWLKRGLWNLNFEFLKAESVPKDEEIVVDRPHELSNSSHDIAFYEAELTKAFSESRREVRSDGICTIVFASKTTASWEAILKAVVDAGWTITGSWPIDTEMESRIAASGQARLASSVHLVCRPRKRADGTDLAGEVGDWRDLLQELPRRIHEWMPRLAAEGVVGADAIFACLGPALEIFSRYSRVEKANGDTVTLREYLEHVWAAVAREALAQVFKGADATGFEPDARLTAMWLWTMNAPTANGTAEDSEAEDANEEDPAKKSKLAGFKLEYDAARKIAQGLGAALETLTQLVEIKGDEARLLPVAERTRHLFGKEQEETARPARKKASAQLNMFAELAEAADIETAWQEKTVTRMGETTLDRVHQAMILFAAGRGEALKRFVVDDGVGRDGKFWRLAQALSALYPTGTDERRWVEGLMARKKQLGF
jgi:adenine-specific DNA methylase